VGRIVVAGPAGDGEERRVDARSNRQPLEFAEVLGTRAGAGFPIFVSICTPRMGSAILPQETLDLAADLAVKRLTYFKY